MIEIVKETEEYSGEKQNIEDRFFKRANQEYLLSVIRDIESGKSELKEHELTEVDR